MKLALLLSREIEEIANLKAELLKRGHEVDVCSFEDLKPSDFLDGSLTQRLSTYDVIYYRAGLTNAGILRLREVIKDRPERLVNSVFLDHPLCHNKLHQALIASELGWAIPPTLMSRNASFSSVVQKLGLPFILKAAEGMQGNRVYLINDESTYAARLQGISGDVVIQKFIKNAGDFRVFTLGNEVHQVFKRVAQNGSFKNNMSLGARGEKVEDPELLEKLGEIALLITRKMDIEIGGVDIIQSAEDGQLYFLEVNINPGWKGLDATLGTNTEVSVADYLEKRFNSLMASS